MTLNRLPCAGPACLLIVALKSSIVDGLIKLVRSLSSAMVVSCSYFLQPSPCRREGDRVLDFMIFRDSFQTLSRLAPLKESNGRNRTTSHSLAGTKTGLLFMCAVR